MADPRERRRFPRFPIYCPLQYRCDSRNLRDASITLNISEGGALISTKSPVDVGTNITVRIFLRNENFFIIARVAHVHKESDNGPYNVGVEFKDKTPTFIRRFNEEIDALTLYQRQRCEEESREVSLAEASMKWYQDSPAWS